MLPPTRGFGILTPYSMKENLAPARGSLHTRRGEGGNDLAANAIRFTNRSNIKVAFTVNFKASEDHSGLKMKFLENGTAPTLNSAESGTAPSYTLLVTMVGELDRSVTEAVPLGNIVVGVSP